VLCKGYEPSEELKKELQDHVKKNDSSIQIPAYSGVCGRDAKDNNGKIRRVELREQDAKRI
jgi:acetyl-CoA synthetase